VTGYAAQFDRVRTHYPALRYLEVVKESLVEGVVDLNNGRVGDG